MWLFMTSYPLKWFAGFAANRCRGRIRCVPAAPRWGRWCELDPVGQDVGDDLDDYDALIRGPRAGAVTASGSSWTRLAETPMATPDLAYPIQSRRSGGDPGSRRRAALSQFLSHSSLPFCIGCELVCLST